jgi:hypothetical protein
VPPPIPAAGTKTKARSRGRAGKQLPDLIRLDRPKPAPWRRAVYVGGAVLCLAAGVLGWLIPVVTGLPFLVAGIVLLALASRHGAKTVNALERRLPEAWRRALRGGIRKVPVDGVRKAVRAPS